MLGKTQEWLANAAKITPAVVIGLESPKRKFPDDHTLSLVKAVFEANGLELTAATEDQGEAVRWREPSGKSWTECLRHARAMLGISLDEMAEKSGIGRSAIARLERGDHKRVPEQSASKLRDVLFDNGVLVIPESRDQGAGVRARVKYR
ncbi:MULTISPECIES: helix-turn-helix domain-containing protein [Rhizobium]|uniref:Helix-turn-helix transcriptional regulator n=1 Tax=Rhizobium phaseoli TaxID=396 RepID=A0A7X6FAX6_9HYPH|nr:MULTISPECIES: helix-turn-helix transcriptional regulator [Rhizobium]MDE8761817.1 helix-turn-helix transcriptional regulator [Rhizobium sp. CBK13]NKF15113.1 helix-turn-helix transcriptional regulator [Rhizobium phaseoli]QPK09209.1 helix-turn-helix transcriptional regulator [Rhizobium phaseoli]